MLDMTEFELEQIAYARAAECKANMYKSEKRVWEMLQKHNNTFGLDWQTQKPIIVPWELKNDYDSKAFYIADFWEPENNIIIEVDGEQHNAYNDGIRDEVLAILGYTTYRIKSLDVWNWHKLSTFICNVYDTERIWYSRILI